MNEASVFNLKDVPSRVQQKPLNLWVGNDQEIKQLDTGSDSYIIFAHPENSPAEDWRMIVAPKAAAKRDLMLGLIQIMTTFAQANGWIPDDQKPVSTQQMPRGIEHKRVSIPIEKVAELQNAIRTNDLGAIQALNRPPDQP